MQALIRRTLINVGNISACVKKIAVINPYLYISSTSKNFGTLSSTISPGMQCNTFLKPCIPIVQQVCGMKIKGKPKLRCKDCYMVVRDERLYVMCKTYGRHKQMAMRKKPINSLILTHATQGKVRGW